MNKLLLSIIAIMLLISTLSCQKHEPTTPLFNGENLENWDLFVGSSLGSDFDSLASEATPEKVFSVVELNGEKVIRISGEVNGSLATKETFENYHLRLVFRWSDKVYSRRNSGLLYHSFGDFGAAFGTWMANIELQLMHQNLGDAYLMLNTTCQTTALKPENSNDFIFDPSANTVQFGQHATGSLIRKSTDFEKPLGEWNNIDLYCFGTTAVHVVNGQTVMVNNNTGIFVDGEIKTLSSGKIQIQSEGAEFFVKSIEIEKIDGLPFGILP
jgi:hypothetical protein